MRKQTTSIVCQKNSETLNEENVKQNLSVIVRYLRIVQNRKFIKDSVLKLFETCQLPDKSDDGGPVKSVKEKSDGGENYLTEIEEILQNNDYVKEFDDFRKEIPSCSNDKTTIFNVTKLKCLGIGSISQEKSSKFQLCYILLLQRFYRFKQILVYDPAFNELDKFILETVFEFKVSEPEEEDLPRKELRKDLEDQQGDHVLYFLPHFPVAEFEKLVEKEKPRLIIGNDIVGQLSHKGLLSENLNRYPNLMMMVMANKEETHSSDSIICVSAGSITDKDGFQKVDNFYRKKRIGDTPRSKKKNRGGPLAIDYEQKEKDIKNKFIVENQSRKYYEQISRKYLFLDDDEVPSFNDLSLFIVQ